MDVAGVDRQEPLDNYDVILINGSVTSTRRSLFDMSFGHTTTAEGATLSFSDLDGGGELTVGDRFTVSGWNNDYDYELIIFYIDFRVSLSRF